MAERSDDGLEEVVLRVAVGRPPVEVSHLASLLREVVLQDFEGESGGLTPSASGNTRVEKS